MIRKLLAGLLLTTFLVATTGFVLVQCCCDISPKKECCRTKDSSGCKTDVSYFKLKADYQTPSTQQIVGFAFCVDQPFDVLSTFIPFDTDHTCYNDTGPPDLYSLVSQSRLQVFRI